VPQRPTLSPQQPGPAALPAGPAAAPSAAPAAAAARAGQLSLGAWGALAAAPPPAAPPPPPPVDFSAPADLDGLRAVLGDCTRCGLCEKRDKLVFGVGDPSARLLIVGEAPGREEDRRGEPFVGESGQMLDRMLRNVLGFGREAVYIANVVKCRPPENRDPQPEEIARCRPVLHAQLRIIRPELVLVLGRVAFQALFDTSEGITRARGSWRALRYPGGEARALVTFHPAYLLREPDAKRLVFEDLKAMARALAGEGEGPPGA
jgi:DNA polymerase